MDNLIGAPTTLPSLQMFTDGIIPGANSEIKTHAVSEASQVIELTKLQFAIGILSFKYVKEIKSFVLSGLYFEGVRQKLHSAGFRKRYTSPTESIYIRQRGSIISEVSTEQMRDYLTGYVETFASDLVFEYDGIVYTIPFEAIRETYLKNSNNIFNKIWLEHLQTHNTPILRDTEKEIYLFFKNKLVIITANNITSKKWNELSSSCIWENQIIQHDFTYSEEYLDSKFAHFISNVNNQEPERILALISAIGYLVHNHFKASEGQVVTLYDQAITDLKHPQGGTGKGLIANALKQVRDSAKIDGKHFDEKNRFKYETISPSTQLVWIDDVKPTFDFSVLYSNLTDGWTIERKYHSQFVIPPEGSPKTLICSNSIIKNSGTSTLRRQFEYELSDHYSKQIIKGDEKPIEKEHGGIFFSNDWSTDEWNKFFSYICACGSVYLENGIIVNKSINVELNRLRQATGSGDFVEWCEDQEFIIGETYLTKPLFDDFKSQYYTEDNDFKQRKFTDWLKAYAAYKGWEWKVAKKDKAPAFIMKLK